MYSICMYIQTEFYTHGKWENLISNFFMNFRHCYCGDNNKKFIFQFYLSDVFFDKVLMHGIMIIDLKYASGVVWCAMVHYTDLYV